MISGGGLLVHPDLRLLAPDPESILLLFQTPSLCEFVTAARKLIHHHFLSGLVIYYPHYHISEMLKNSVPLLENKIYRKSTISIGRK